MDGDSKSSRSPSRASCVSTPAKQQSSLTPTPTRSGGGTCSTRRGSKDTPQTPVLSRRQSAVRTENQDSDSTRSTSPAGLKAAMLNGTGGSKQSRGGGGTPTTGGDISSDECNGDSSPSTATAVSDKIKINGNGGASSNGGTNGSANTNGGGKMATSVEDGSNNNGLDSIPCA